MSCGGEGPGAGAGGGAALLARACARFERRFGRAGTAAAAAPGRVNLIGDHVDYCDGFVLPAALQFQTLVVGGPSSSSTCTVLSLLPGGGGAGAGAGEELETSFQLPVEAAPAHDTPAWARYITGVVHHFPGAVCGFDAVVVSDVPLGAGVSSSAALEVATFTFLEALTGTTVDPVKKALLCQKAEHEFAGMPCGIMDQFVSTMAKKDHALLIDCQSLQAEHIPLSSEQAVMLVINSNVKHQLTGSEYPQRRAQCARAARLMHRDTLRGATVQDLEEAVRRGCEPVVAARAEHVISEIARTQHAARCLRAGDYTTVGALLSASHESLRARMQVSCPELDALVRACAGARGVLGARMTGGGFGGCVVALVQKEFVEEVKARVLREYSGTPSFFICSPSDGARVIPL